MITRQLKPGDKVTYLAHPGAKYEHGIVKSIPRQRSIVFVVYKCGGDWEHYHNYTAAATDIASLKYGWL